MFVKRTSELEALLQEYSGRYPEPVINRYRRAVGFLESSSGLREVYQKQSYHLERLKGNLSGYLSIRLNDGRRLIFSVETEQEPQVISLREISNHYS